MTFECYIDPACATLIVAEDAEAARSQYVQMVHDGLTTAHIIADEQDDENGEGKTE